MWNPHKLACELVVHNRVSIASFLIVEEEKTEQTAKIDKYIIISGKATILPSNWFKKFKN